MERRKFLIASALSSFSVRAVQASYATKPIRVIVAAPAGSGPDIVTRKVGQLLGEKLGQSVVVENKSGARGAIGARAVAKAEPDGHTLIMGYASSFCLEPALYRSVQFDSMRDFEPVAMIGSLSPALLIRNDLPINTLGELIEHARRSPNTLTVGNSSSTNTLLTALLEQEANITLYKIPYATSGEARLDLLGGRLDLHFDPPAAIPSQIDSGRVKPLVMYSAQRAPSLSDTPTVAEAGFPALAFSGWNGFLAPAGTPKPIITELNAAIRDIVNAPETAQTLSQLGLSPEDATPDEFRKIISDMISRFTAVAERAGLRQ